jgi:hypothetical protein
MELQEQQDLIPLGTAGKLPIFEEPVMNAFADKASKDLKKKPIDKLTANDRFVLDLTKQLPIMDLLKDGYMTVTMDVGSGIKGTFRTLVYSQLETIANEVSRFQQQRELRKIGDKEHLVWQPTLEETRVYQVKRTLAESLVAIMDRPIGQVTGEKIQYLNGLDGMLVNALYRKMQQFFTATSLLFPSDNQKELIETLKKV